METAFKTNLKISIDFVFTQEDPTRLDWGTKRLKEKWTNQTLIYWGLIFGSLFVTVFFLFRIFLFRFSCVYVSLFFLFCFFSYYNELIMSSGSISTRAAKRCQYVSACDLFISWDSKWEKRISKHVPVQIVSNSKSTIKWFTLLAHTLSLSLSLSLTRPFSFCHHSL